MSKEQENKIFPNIKLSDYEMQFTHQNCKSQAKFFFLFLFLLDEVHSIDVSVNAIFAFASLFSLPSSLFLSLTLFFVLKLYIVLLCVARDATARLASQHELIRLTYLPDALGPPCTVDASVGPSCTCTHVCVCEVSFI